MPGTRKRLINSRRIRSTARVNQSCILCKHLEVRCIIAHSSAALSELHKSCAAPQYCNQDTVKILRSPSTRFPRYSKPWRADRGILVMTIYKKLHLHAPGLRGTSQQPRAPCSCVCVRSQNLFWAKAFHTTVILIFEKIALARKVHTRILPIFLGLAPRLSRHEKHVLGNGHFCIGYCTP